MPCSVDVSGVSSTNRQSNNFSKPPNVKRPRLAPLPMINTGDQDVLALPSPNTRPRKKCHSNSGGSAVRLENPLVRLDAREDGGLRPPPLRRLTDVELESPGSQSQSSQPDSWRGSGGSFSFFSHPQTLKQLREGNASDQQCLSETASEVDYMTPQDQPVKQRTDMILKEDVANQRISHQSKLQHNHKNVALSVTSEALPASLPPNLFYLMHGAPCAVKREPLLIVQSSSRLYNEFSNVRSIGDGTFGCVYRAVSRVDGSTYAIKVIRRAIKTAGTKEMVYKLREAHALSYLQLCQPFCPYILRYFSSWIQDAQVYIQTELCSGGSVSQRLSTNRMSEAELRELCRQMCIALVHLHSNGVAHLDVKPDNILESAPGSGSYRLADFGLCMPLDVAHQGPRLPEGDSRYLCGELLNEESICHFDKADVFALGASLLELSLGRELTRSGSEYQALRQGHVPSIDASDAFNELVRSMLHPVPESRSSAQAILDLLNAAPDDGGRKPHDADMETAAQRRIAQLEEELRLSKQQNDVLQRDYMHRLN